MKNVKITRRLKNVYLSENPRCIVIILKFVDIGGITQIDVLVNSSICVHLL